MAKLSHIAASSVLILLVACGDRDGNGASDAGRKQDTSTSISTTTTTSATPDNFFVTATIKGTYPKSTRHIIRVERSTGKQVFERSLDSSLKTAEALAPGDYRVLSYQRPCREAICAPGDPDTAFGEPVDLCGAQFSIVADKSATATVEIVPGEGCTVTTS